MTAPSLNLRGTPTHKEGQHQSVHQAVRTTKETLALAQNRIPYLFLVKSQRTHHFVTLTEPKPGNTHNQ